MAASSAGEKSLVNSTVGFACLTLDSTGPQSGTAPSETPSSLRMVQPSFVICSLKPFPITVPYALLPLMIEAVLVFELSRPPDRAPSTQKAKPWPYQASVGSHWKMPQYLPGFPL